MLVLIFLILAAVSFFLGAFKFEFKTGDRVIVDWLLLGLFFLTLTLIVPLV